MTEHVQAPEGSAEALLEFLEWAGRTGEMNPKTAEAWAVACRRVLNLDSDPAPVDLRSANVDELLSRFENLNRTKYTSGSMATYKSRFSSSVLAYLAWLANEPWKPSSRKSKKASPPPVSKSPTTVAPAASAAVEASVETPAHTSTPLLVAYRMPLRPGLMIDLALPADLTPRDAKRIAAFVESLAFSAEEQDDPE